MTVPAAAAGAGVTNGAAADKRARRRAAQKQNKAALKAAESAQQAKFAANREDEKAQQTKQEAADETKVDADDTNTDASAAPPSSSSVIRVVRDSNGESTEFVREVIELDNPALSELAAVFERFHRRGEESVQTVDEDAESTVTKTKEQRIDEEIREQSGEGAAGDGTLSRRKQKERDRLAIADLKQLVAKPDVVELHDANSADPKLLVYLKSYRNTVPVPLHWSQKRKYLQNKRGYEKPPFQLPACIENTGISKMRGAQMEKDATATNKQRQRAKMQPKMGKIDIDYQILHDAFFRYQTKPPMTEHGALYYEGREHEVKMTEKKPGQYSAALRDALGMKDDTTPPPWLLHMQRVGPPPAYPHLAIPGVSAPIPAGARYGFGEGEWGKPPVDQNGRPLYGDVFGVERRTAAEIEHIDTSLWGTLESEEEPHVTDGTASTVSTMSGLTTPEVLSLRKADGTGTETPDTVAQRPKSLYTVLEEKRTSVGSGIFGTQHTYVLPDAAGAVGAVAGTQLTDQEKRVLAQQAKNRGQVDVALNPDELEGLDAAALKRKYDARLQEESDASKKQLTADDEDDDDAGGQKKKRRKKGGGEKDKAYKDFKF
jgi:splicing factor 3B subunit 2